MQLTHPDAGIATKETRIRYRIGVDIGGTFTDVVLMGDDGRMAARKISSTPEDCSRGIAEGLAAVLADRGATPDNGTSVVHATTVATDTVLERKGARTGLITTLGFRDVLEMRRLRIRRCTTFSMRSRRRSYPGACAGRSTNASGPTGRYAGSWIRPGWTRPFGICGARGWRRRP